jgi:hypothetical protein
MGNRESNLSIERGHQDRWSWCILPSYEGENEMFSGIGGSEISVIHVVE